MLVRQILKRCIYTLADPRPWLFVGLGNPGDKFLGTRHNVGFEFIDAFAKSHGIAMDSVHCKAIFGKGFVNDVPVFLAKPQTYMNLSGESSGPLAAYYKLPLNRVLVLHDDMALPCGVLRLNPLGNHGSHNGLKSVIHHFRENREFPRLRIGIGKPAGQMDPKAFLLQKFNARARERIDYALQEGVDALAQVLSKGVTESARCFNKEQKYKHLRLQTVPAQLSSFVLRRVLRDHWQTLLDLSEKSLRSNGKTSVFLEQGEYFLKDLVLFQSILTPYFSDESTL